jgi:hypothetical protein
MAWRGSFGEAGGNCSHIMPCWCCYCYWVFSIIVFAEELDRTGISSVVVVALSWEFDVCRRWIGRDEAEFWLSRWISSFRHGWGPAKHFQQP